MSCDAPHDADAAQAIIDALHAGYARQYGTTDEGFIVDAPFRLDRSVVETLSRAELEARLDEMADACKVSLFAKIAARGWALKP